MFYLIHMLLGALTGFVPLIPIIALFQLALVRRDRAGKTKVGKGHLLATYLFCLDLLCILVVTGVPDIFNLKFDPNVNLVPLTDFFSSPHQYILNILMFVPVGFLLPMLWRKFEKKSLVFSCGFFFSLAIELAQIFSYRVTDIDDLLMNTLGVMGGYFLFMGAKRFFPKVSRLSVEGENYWRWEPYFYFGVVWLSVFFIQPLIQPHIDTLIWGQQMIIQ